MKMKKLSALTVLIFTLSFGASVAFSKTDPAAEQKIHQAKILRLEAYRTDCLTRYNNERFCRKRVLKQCREALEKRECISLMSKMPSTKL